MPIKLKHILSLINYFLILCYFYTRINDVDAALAKNSSPFDPFRLECPFFHGIIKLNFQRVESAEGVRSDILITSFCENIKKTFPSPRDHITGTGDESCRWTSNFRIPGEPFDFSDTCSGKEFISGISRQEFGEYGLLCCKLKDRKKGDCSTVEFILPNERSPVLEIGGSKRVLVAFGQDKGRVTAQFCDLDIMSKRELDDEFIANAKARLLNQVQEDGIRNKGADEAEQQQTPIRQTTSKPSPPGVLPPSGFSQAKGKPGTRRPQPGSENDNDKQNLAKKVVDDRSNGVQRLATVQKGIGAPPSVQPPSSNAGRPSIDKKQLVKVTKTTVGTTTKRPPITKVITKATTTQKSQIVDIDNDTTPPDPARFQVLGIPRPVGSDSLFVQQPSELPETRVPDTISGVVSAGGSNVKKPQRQQITLPPITDSEEESTLPPKKFSAPTENTRASVTNANKEAENFEDEATSDQSRSRIGNLAADSIGIVISPQNASVQSAVAPAKPLYTVLPPLPKFVASLDNKPRNEKAISEIIEDRKLSAVANFIPEAPQPDIPETSSTTTTTTTTTVTTTRLGPQRLECDTNTAFRDPLSGLVMACGQGDEIWLPARCRPGLLCLIAKDSSYRLCCSVHIPSN